jgi:hypothetical protein
MMNPVFKSPRRKIFSGVFPAVFSPLDLFKEGDVGFWSDPSGANTLFQDDAGTTPVTAPADPVGLLLDSSGNSLNATQATSGERPFYAVVPKGGRRNIATHTNWTTAVPGSPGTAPVDWALGFGAGTQTSFDGGVDNEGAQAIRFDVDAGGRVFYYYPLNVVVGQTYTFSADLFSISGDIGVGMIFAPAGASGSSTRVQSPTSTGRYSVVFTCTGSGAVQVRVGIGITGAIGATAHASWKRPQIEVGSVNTPYQSVVSGLDVRQFGVASLDYLARTDVAQSLNVTLPDLGSNATSAFATESGISILKGQVIGAGQYDILKGEQTFQNVVINRHLRLSEEQQLRQYLISKMP